MNKNIKWGGENSPLWSIQRARTKHAGVHNFSMVKVNKDILSNNKDVVVILTKQESVSKYVYICVYFRKRQPASLKMSFLLPSILQMPLSQYLKEGLIQRTWIWQRAVFDTSRKYSPNWR